MLLLYTAVLRMFLIILAQAYLNRYSKINSFYRGREGALDLAQNAEMSLLRYFLSDKTTNMLPNARMATQTLEVAPPVCSRSWRSRSMEERDYRCVSLGKPFGPFYKPLA